jgi:cell fate regulator YaaT (PSP1 superfamily)
MTTHLSDSPAGESPEIRESPANGSFVHVLFKGQRIEVLSNPARLPLAAGDKVVTEVERGNDLGEVLALDAPDIRRRRHLEPQKILRLAGPEDLGRLAEARAKDDEALRVAKERVRHFGLPMHLLDAEHQFDGNRVTFYFTADHRVDFRQLVRDLAGIFRTRIELRQISTREAARRLGGLGFCGRGLCCRAFLCDFEHVTLQTARLQKMGLNPTRLSGICGRLLCCLMFEGPPEQLAQACPDGSPGDRCPNASGRACGRDSGAEARPPCEDGREGSGTSGA